MGKIGSLFWEITAETSKFQKGLSDSKDQASKFKNGINDAVQGLTGFNVQTLAGAGAVVALGNAVKSAVVGWVNYNHEMDKGALATGMQVTEFSRLVQAGDDVRVSQEAITTAMSLATKNGFNPSIDSLAQLADKLQGMSDPTQRAAELSNIFGRGWNDIYPLLQNGGQALRDATAAQADGLLVTEQSIKDGDELYAIWDTLGDTGTALANTIAKDLTPALKDVGNGMITAMNAAMLLVDWETKLRAVQSQHAEELLSGKMTYAEYVTEQKRANDEANKGLPIWTKFSQAFQFTQGAADKMSASVRIMSESEYESAAAARYNDLAHTGFAAALTTVTPQIENLRDTGSGAADAMKNIALGAWGATDAALAQGKAYNDLKAATDNLKSAQDNWMKGAGGDVKAELEAQGVKGEKLNLALGAIDSQMGTNLLGEQRYKDNIKELVDAYAKGGSDALPKFTSGLEGMKSSWMEQNDAVQALRTTVVNLQSSLDLLVSKNYVVGITTITGSSGTSDATVTSPGKRKFGGDQFANGGSYVVPGGYNETWPVGPNMTASSGERVTITPAGQTTNMGGITINVSGAGSPSATAEAIALRLQSFGAQYQGG